MDKEKLSVAKAVAYVVDKMRDGEEISGYELKQRCCRLNPDLSGHYVETFLRKMRLNRRAEMVCINRTRSIYVKLRSK